MDPLEVAEKLGKFHGILAIFQSFIDITSILHHAKAPSETWGNTAAQELKNGEIS